MHTLSMRFIQVDPGARADITDISSSPLRPWGSFEPFHNDYPDEPPNVATLEWNHTILDGSAQEFPDNPEPDVFGFWSGAMSGADGLFENPPTLDMFFGSQRRSRGFTFYFYPHTDDYASMVRITWYSSHDDEDVIQSSIYELNYNLAAAHESVGGWRRVKFEFLSTNIPFRYIKLYGINFGISGDLSDREISSARILEEIDPTSESLSVNTMNAIIRTRNSIFSPITSPDYDDMMMARQMLEMRRDGILFGKFFLDPKGWADPHQDGIEFELFSGDAIGVMDSCRFMGGMYVDEPVTSILDEIFGIVFPTGTIKYVLDPAFEGELINGWIPIVTCAAALQHICFALNATADTARIGDVYIYPREVDVKSDGIPQTDDMQPFIDIVDIQSYEPPHYYPTNEPGYVTLDGILGEFLDNVSDHNLGWCSASMSNENGLFTTPPRLTVTFSTSHNMESMAFDFGPYENEFMSRMRIVFYNGYDEVISNEVYEFTQSPGVVEGNVRGYRKFEIEVLETSAPFRYAKIMSIDYGKSYYVPLSEQYRRGRDTPADFVSSVNVTSHNFVPSSEVVTAHNGILSLGINPITFTEPLYDLTIEGGIIIEAHANHAVINVTTQGDVIVSGRRYIDNMRIHSIRREFISSEAENAKNYEYYTIVSPDRGDMIAQELFAYHSSPVITESDVRLGAKEIGYIAQVETRGRGVVGVITRLDITNLRSDVAIMEVRGHVG